MSNELDTNDNQTKSNKKSISGSDSSESNESDYIEENTARYKINMVQTPVVNQLDSPKIANVNIENNQVHPFMLEGMVEEKKRRASAIPNREMILEYALVAEKEEEVSAGNFDENYMMFGGDHYMKVHLLFTRYSTVKV